MNLSSHLSASGIFFTLLFCNLIKGGFSNDCTWSYITRPPVASFSPFPPALCDPFNPNSSFTLPCQVKGPSQVDINWYFVTPGNGEKLLRNSTKYRLVSSVIVNNNSVTVSVNVTFSDIQESVDNGTYVCRARVSDLNKVLSPSVEFDIQLSESFKVPCDSTPRRDVNPLCAILEDIPPASSTISSQYVPVQHLTTVYTISPLTTPTETIQSSNHILSSYHYVSATPSFTQTDHAPLASPAPHTDSTHPALVPPVATTSAGDLTRTSAMPPVNTWFYLLSVVVVLTFLMIILVLILVIFCIMKRGGRRHLVHFPSPQEEIRIQRTGRQPSDPLPRIGNNMPSNNSNGLDTSTFPLSTLPQNQLSFIHSAPAASPTGNHAASLQHLSFNLGPSFQSNSTLYDEIGPPSISRDAPDIRRHSLDYVNRWQFTVESDSSSSSYAIPPDAYWDETSHIEESGTSCITDRTCVDAVVTVTDDSEGSMSSATTTSTTSCMWLSNTPITIAQCDRSPWGHRDTFGDGGIFPLSPLESSEVSRSPLSSEDLPEGFSESETDDNSLLSSIPCVVVRESHTPSDQNKNTLSGQTFELDSNDCRIQLPVPESPPTLHNFSPFFPNSSTSKIITRENEREYLQTPPNCSRGDSPPDMDESLLDSRGTDGDNSRSSSSSSGCTDISKYSGDYDRDPAYMRLLLGQVRPLLPGNASPEMLSEDYNGQQRADSGMDSLYREGLSPTGGVPVSTCIGNLYRSTHSSGHYKSLNNLTLDAESMYVHVCHNQHCHCRLFQKCCTD